MKSKALKYWQQHFRTLPDGAQEAIWDAISELEAQEAKPKAKPKAEPKAEPKETKSGGVAKRPRKSKKVSARS